MVFSFFKKQPPEKKMVARPAASPRAMDDKGGTPGVLPEDKPRVSAVAPVGLARADVPFATPVARTDTQPLDLSEFLFSETAPEFQVEAEVDPIDAEAEEAAMLYANGQDGAVRLLLENATRAYRSGPGERLWLMLFDLFRLTGQKGRFRGFGTRVRRVFREVPTRLAGGRRWGAGTGQGAGYGVLQG
jgi:hypothetical protein